MTPALFLDRDGVINVDHAYVHKREDFEFIPGIFDLCRVAGERGFPVFVVTNQAGIGRGLYTEADFHALTLWMCERFAAEGTPLAHVYFCPTHPQAGIGAYRVESPMRKPAPGMILQARDEFGIDLARSAMVGDKPGDIQAAEAAGIGLRLLFAPGRPAVAGSVATLAQAAGLLRAHWAVGAGR